MNDTPHSWFRYAAENLAVARLAFDRQYYNACLQNAQQSVEKFLKAVLLEKHIDFPKTHSIQTLLQLTLAAGCAIDLTDDESDLLDTIYLPSKYPMGSALPHFEPDQATSAQCVQSAERVRASTLAACPQFATDTSPFPPSNQ